MTVHSSNLVFTQAQVADLARHILQLDPDPAPRFRLLRDVLRCTPGDASLQEAAQNLYESRWVKELAAYQQPDGAWGRFHTQDSRVKSPIPTSEHAIRRALALGLDRRSPIIEKAAGYIAAHIQGKVAWSDRVESQDDPRVFLFNIRTISAAMLALIDPRHPILAPSWKYWAEVIDAAFAGGAYDARAELSRCQALSGIRSRALYPFHMYYPVIVLSTAASWLPRAVEAKMLAYLLHKPDGMYYVCGHPIDSLPRPDDRGFQSWLHGQEVLARFEGWKDFAPRTLNWLWGQRDESGLWDSGKATGRSFAMPLSESWRKPGSRKIDCSVRVLCLLRRYFE